MEKRNAFGPYSDFPYPFEKTMGRLVKKASVILPKYILLKRNKNYMARTGKRSGNMDPEYSVKRYLIRVGKRQENDDKRYIPRLGKRGGYKGWCNK